MKQLLKFIKEKISKLLNIVNEYFKENPKRIFFIFIIFLASFLRLYGIGTIPKGLTDSELEVVRRIMAVSSSGDMWLGTYFQEGILIYVGILVSKIFGFSEVIFRIVSALFGIATVWLAYLFARDWFNRQAGYFAALLLAISSWHITISRNIDSDVLVPFFMLLLFVITTLAYRTKKMVYFVLSGLIFALSLYVNIVFTFIPVLFILAGLYFYLKNKKFLTAYLREITVALNVFILFAIPYFIVLFKFWNDLFSSFSFDISITEGLNNFGSAIESLFLRGETNFFINLGSEPIIDPLMGMLLVFGIFFALFHIHRRKNFFLIILFFTMMLPAVFTKQTILDKLSGIIVAVVMISAFTLNYLTRHWQRTFPVNKNANNALWVIIIFFFTVSTVYNVQRYFFVWAEAKPVHEIHKHEMPASPHAVIPLKKEI